MGKEWEEFDKEDMDSMTIREKLRIKKAAEKEVFRALTNFYQTVKKDPVLYKQVVKKKKFNIDKMYDVLEKANKHRRLLNEFEKIAPGIAGGAPGEDAYASGFDVAAKKFARKYKLKPKTEMF